MSLNETLEAVRLASRKLALLDTKKINEILIAVADAAVENIERILTANVMDLQKMEVSNPKYDRLKLTRERICDIASDIRNVASLPSPLGNVLYEDVRPNGLKIKKVSVPFGVIGVIYEARPNVSFDVFSLPSVVSLLRSAVNSGAAATMTLTLVAIVYVSAMFSQR